MDVRQRTSRHDYSAVRAAREGCEGALYLVRVAHVNRVYLYPERRCCSLDGAELADTGGGTRITENRRSGHPRCDLLEQFEPFCTQAVFEIRHPSGVTAWACKAIDETTSDWVNDLHEYDRHGARCL